MLTRSSVTAKALRAMYAFTPAVSTPRPDRLVRWSASVRGPDQPLLPCHRIEHVHRIRLGFDAIPDRIDAGADEGMYPFVAAELIELHHADAPGRELVVDRHVHRLIVATTSGTGE